MVAEFYRLSQGLRTVTEYETELRRLSKFVLEGEHTDVLLAHRFEDGLATEIRAVLGMAEYRDMRMLVTAAQKSERVVADQRVMRCQHRDAMTRRFSPWRRPG